MDELFEWVGDYSVCVCMASASGVAIGGRVGTCA